MAPLDPFEHAHGPGPGHDGLEHGVRRVTLLVSRNGSLLLVPEDGPDGTGSLSGLGALLVATFAGGLALNVLLVLALMSCEPRTRAKAAQALLMAANALDCLLNAPSAAVVVTSWGALVDRSPHSARALCKFSAASGQLTAILQTLALLVLVLDRCVSLTVPHGSSSTFSLTQSASARKGTRTGPTGVARLVSMATWGLLWSAAPLALALTLPIAIAGKVRMFPTRYACGLVRLQGDPPWLGVVVLVLGYFCPWAALVGGVSMAARRAAQQRWRRRQLELAAQQQGRGVGATSPAGGLTFSLVDTPLGHLSLDDYRALTLATVLVCMYLAMHVPGILSTQVLQVMVAKPRTSHGPDDLWPVVTGTYETVLVWLRMQFAVVSPGLIVILSRDVRRRVVEMMQCLYQACCCCLCCCFSRRTNAVGQSLPQRRYGNLAAPVSTPGAAPGASNAGLLAHAPRWARLRHRNVDALTKSECPETLVSAGTAVLFATGQGLHLRTLDPRWGCEEEDADDVSTWVKGGPADGSFHTPPPSDSLPRYVFQFCDLAVIDDLPKSSPEASTAVAAGALVAPAVRRKVVQDADEREPSLTREELQASLAKPRSLSNSYRKNVRFASVVSEIPIVLPLASVAEAEAESGAWSDPTSSSTTSSTSAAGAVSSSASSTDSPVRYVVGRPRTMSIELALVSGDLLSPPPESKRLGVPFPKTSSASSSNQSKRTSKV